MKRLVCALALVVAGCSGDDDSTVTAEGADEVTTTTTATTTTIAGLDGTRILVAAGEEVVRVVDGMVEPVAQLDGEVAVAYGDGTGAVVAEVDGTLVDLSSGEPVAIDLGAPGVALLYDLVAIDGEASALYGLRDDSEGEAKGDVALLGLASGAQRSIATAFAPEYHTFAGSIGGGMLAVSSYSDLTESVTMYPVEEGKADPVWSPTIDIPYNAAPLVLDAILSPDGATIAWLSGPENGEGTWEVVVAGVDGLEQVRTPLGLAEGEAAVRLDFDGERLLVSIERDEAPASPLLVDAAGGTPVRLDGLTGVATFD